MSGSEESLKTHCERRREALRKEVLGFPPPFAVRGITVERIVFSTFKLEKIIIECEPGSWQSAHLYLPLESAAPIPALVLTCGHGGSKSNGYSPLAAQLYAQMGCAVILADPIGEEERNAPYGLGLRGHRHGFSCDRLNQYGRPFHGKVVYDLVCCIDYLLTRDEIDGARIGCAGSSMGGTVAQLLIAIEPRLRAGLVSSWTADYHLLDGSIGCCNRLPGMIAHANQIDLLALAAPHCATMVCAGDQDDITPPLGLKEMAVRLTTWWQERGAPEHFRCEIEKGGGHRPYHMTVAGIQWLSKHLQFGADIDWGGMKCVTLGSIMEGAQRRIEPLYNVDRHHKGTLIPALPLDFTSPEKLKVLDDEVLRRWSLNEDDFTLQGFLARLEISPLETIRSLPPSQSPLPEAARQRTLDHLGRWSRKPAWADAPLPEKPLTQCELVAHGTTYFYEQWELGFCDFRLHLYRHASLQQEPRTVELRLSRRSEGPDTSENWTGAPLPSDLAFVDLARLDDNELLLELPSLATNLQLVLRSLNLLSSLQPPTHSVRLVSEVPRIGEWVVFESGMIDHFTLLATQAIELSLLNNGRAEGVLPRTQGFHWIDLFLATPDCTMHLPESYFTPEAKALLNPTWFNAPSPLVP